MAPPDEEIMRTVADDLPVGVWVARAPAGDFVYANRMFGEIMGMDARRDLVAGQYAEPYGIYTREGELYPEARLPFVQALQSGSTVTVDDIVVHRGDGKRVHIRAQARPMRDADGQISHVVVAFIDISREVEAERARDAFLAVAAHELRTPIGTLQLRIQLLRKRFEAGVAMSAEQLSLGLQACERQVRSLTRLSNLLLDRARIRAGHFELALEWVDLVDLVRACIAPFIESAQDGEPLLTLTGAPSVIGLFDKARIEHIVNNLVSNARKYGEGRPVEIRVETTDERVRILVTDQGIGIDPDHHAGLFQPFARADSARSFGGLGLGLWIAAQAARGMGGTIEVESLAGQGARFIVELPWQR